MYRYLFWVEFCETLKSFVVSRLNIQQRVDYTLHNCISEPMQSLKRLLEIYWDAKREFFVSCRQATTEPARLEIGWFISDSVCSDIREKRWLSHQPLPSRFGEVHGESGGYLTHRAGAGTVCGWVVCVCVMISCDRSCADCLILQYYSAYNCHHNVLSFIFLFF